MLSYLLDSVISGFHNEGRSACLLILFLLDVICGAVLHVVLLMQLREVLRGRHRGHSYSSSCGKRRLHNCGPLLIPGFVRGKALSHSIGILHSPQSENPARNA